MDTILVDDISNKLALYSQNKAQVCLFKNDSLEIKWIIIYKKRKSGKTVLKTNHQFFLNERKLRSPSRWKTDMPFLSKLTGIGGRWEHVRRNMNSVEISATTRGSYARLPGNKGIIRLECEETLKIKEE